MRWLAGATTQTMCSSCVAGRCAPLEGVLQNGCLCHMLGHLLLSSAFSSWLHVHIIAAWLAQAAHCRLHCAALAGLSEVVLGRTMPCMPLTWLAPADGAPVHAVQSEEVVRLRAP